MRALREGPQALQHRAAQRHRRLAQLQPAVVQSLGGVQTPRWVLLQEALDEVLRMQRQAGPAPVQGNLRLLDGLGDLRVRGATEGRAPHEQHVADHSHAPQVALAAVTATYHLRAGVMQGAAGHLQQLVLLEDLGEAEVDELQPVLRAVHPVLKLQIPVDDVVPVEVVHRLQHLPHHLCGVLLAVDLLLAKPGVQLATAHLHDKPHLSVPFICMQKPAYIGMIQAQVYLHLTLQESQALWL
mmetsp:Transcript_137505/g.325694  ORF Transcript_137505/g.325694 Transcript_137505/m.325694 type:complete len:241 (-) Transcript_137505:267-989(-)